MAGPRAVRQNKAVTSASSGVSAHQIKIGCVRADRRSAHRELRRPSGPAYSEAADLEPAAAHVYSESHQEERRNQPETAKQQNCLGRMIVGLRFGS